ncbi:hypothetical protein EV121DRAFT_274954, partial [Schizophyllum commune]
RRITPNNGKAGSTVAANAAEMDVSVGHIIINPFGTVQEKDGTLKPRCASVPAHQMQLVGFAARGLGIGNGKEPVIVKRELTSEETMSYLRAQLPVLFQYFDSLPLDYDEDGAILSPILLTFKVKRGLHIATVKPHPGDGSDWVMALGAVRRQPMELVLWLVTRDAIPLSILRRVSSVPIKSYYDLAKDDLGFTAQSAQAAIALDEDCVEDSDDGEGELDEVELELVTRSVGSLKRRHASSEGEDSEDSE